MILARAVARFSLPLARPIPVRRGTRHVVVTERHGLLVGLRDGQGHMGFGECSPLPGTDEALLAEMEASLRAGSASPHAFHAPVTYALEMAEIHLEAARRTVTPVALLAELGGTIPAAEVPVQGVFIGSADAVPRAHEEGDFAGFERLKVKVGAQTVEEDARLIEALLSVLPPSVLLRLDANQGYSPVEARALVQQIDAARIEYIEEPVATDQLLDVGPSLGVPVALDESVGCASKALLEAPFVSTWVLKPMLGHLLQGGARVRHAAELGKRVVISSAVESGLGLSYLAALAGRDASTAVAAGIATDTWLAEDVVEPRFSTRGGRIDLMAPPPRLRPDVIEGLTWDTLGEGRRGPHHGAQVEELRALCVADTPLLTFESGRTLTRREAWNRASGVGFENEVTPVVEVTDTTRAEDVVVKLLGAWATNRLVHLPPPGSDTSGPSPWAALPRSTHAAGTILHTSGTTETPKRIVHTSHAHLWAARRVTQRLGLTQGSRYLLSLALHHVGGLAILMRALVAGATVVVPKDRSQLATAIRALRPTHISLVPTQLERLLNEEGPALFEGLETILIGGAPLSEATRARCVALAVPLTVSYGSTESAALVAADNDPLALRAAGYAGRPLAPGEVRVDDEGRIQLRGKTLAAGRLTGDTWSPLHAPGGWFNTGDLGRLKDERLYVLGRADRMFITGGENVHPESIEGALLGIPGVAAAAVVTISDPTWGERPVAFVAFGEDQARDGAALREALEGTLPRFALPDRFHALPPEQATRTKPDLVALAALAQNTALPSL